MTNNYKIKLYIYSRCSTCIKAKKYLEQKFKNIPLEIQLLEKENISVDDLLNIKNSLHLNSFESFLNTKGVDFKKDNIQFKIDSILSDSTISDSLKDTNICQLINSSFRYLKRPLLVIYKDNNNISNVIFGFKETVYDNIIK